MSKKLKLFVLASVILNIVLTGIVAGHMAHRFGHWHDDKMLRFIEKTELSEIKKTAYKEKLQQALSEKKYRNSGRQEHEKAMAILTTKTFDADLFRARLEHIFEKQDQHKKQMIDVIVELASELNQQDRKALAEILRKPPPNRFPR